MWEAVPGAEASQRFLQDPAQSRFLSIALSELLVLSPDLHGCLSDWEGPSWWPSFNVFVTNLPWHVSPETTTSSMNSKIPQK